MCIRDRSKRSHGKRAPRITESMIYYRDPYLKEIVRRIADGKCQLCGMAAPFIDRNNEPYLEEHHVQRLADGGEDTIDNDVALCPNSVSYTHLVQKENYAVRMYLNLGYEVVDEKEEEYILQYLFA